MIAPQRLSKLIVIISLSVGLSASTWAAADSDYATSIPGPALEQGEVWSAEDAANSLQIAHMMRAKLEKDTGANATMKRDAHPKHHGCVKADLSIDPAHLPKSLRVGLFAGAGQYQSVIRFSNGSPNPNKHDKDGDARGMAVKIMGVPYASYLEQIGEEKDDRVHDLVFMNSEVFFNEGSKSYVQMVAASMGGPLKLAWFAVTHPHSVAILAKLSSQKVANPLDIDYHSAVPYKLGKSSMRMLFKSCKQDKEEVPKNAAANFLGLRLAEYLEKNDSCFDFYVQANNNLAKNKIEEPMRAWDQKVSPLLYVGKLTIAKQSGVRSQARQEFCENVTYNPWRAPVDNRPMGVVNRIRLDVYTQNAKFRLDHSNTTAPRPQSHADIP